MSAGCWGEHRHHLSAVTCCWTFAWPVPSRDPLPTGRRRPHSISLNHLYVHTGRGGQRRLSAFAEAAKAGWIDVVLAAGLRLPSGPLALDLKLYPPDARKRDADGCLKLVIDAISDAQAVLFLQDGHSREQAKRLADDYRVVDLHVHRHDPDRGRPRIEAVIRSFDP